MSGGGFQHHRTYSQSRFPPPSVVGNVAPAGFSTLEKNQRSKSFDNRRDFWSPPDNSPSQQYGASPRTHFAADSSNFFNDSITVPIQKTGPSGGAPTLPYSSPTSNKQYRSAIELNTDNSDEEWKSYDRTVRYNHNRTVLPPVNVPRSHYHDEYSSRHHRIEPPPPAAYAQRYPEPDYSGHVQQREQQSHQQQQQHNESMYRSQRQQHSDSRAAEAAAGVYRPQAYYDEDYVGASTFGRSAAGGASTGGAGHRSYHESYARESGGGGGGRNYSQHYSNGYGYGGNMANHKSHVNTSKGGLFGGKSASKSKHRDVSLPVQKRPRIYHKIHCCCFSFYWPPWAYEPVAPPTPIFYDRKAFARRGPPPPNLLTPQISPRQGGGGPPQRFVASPEPPPSTINQHPPQPLQPPPPSLLHPNQGGLMPPPAVHY